MFDDNLLNDEVKGVDLTFPPKLVLFSHDHLIRQVRTIYFVDSDGNWAMRLESCQAILYINRRFRVNLLVPGGGKGTT